jgi:hypothetical protein
MKRRTNVQFIKHIMEYSKHGALMQAFVLDAIANRADVIAASKPEDFPEHGMVAPEAWISCAKELKAAIEANYNYSPRG